MVQIVQMFSHWRQGLTMCQYHVRLLMAWWCKEPGHPQPWYRSNLLMHWSYDCFASFFQWYHSAVLSSHLAVPASPVRTPEPIYKGTRSGTTTPTTPNGVVSPPTPTPTSRFGCLSLSTMSSKPRTKSLKELLASIPGFSMKVSEAA